MFLFVDGCLVGLGSDASAGLEVHVKARQGVSLTVSWIACPVMVSMMTISIGNELITMSTCVLSVNVNVYCYMSGRAIVSMYRTCRAYYAMAEFHVCHI